MENLWSRRLVHTPARNKTARRPLNNEIRPSANHSALSIGLIQP